MMKMYSAPRQGQFAAVLLVSFCLHITAFVASNERVLKQQENTVSEIFLAKIAEEITTPLAVGDKVSLAVIANRYDTDPAISYVAIYDKDETLLVPVGQDNANAGKETLVTNNGQVLGKVLLKTTPVNRAQMVSSHWLFLCATLVLHLMLWFIYGYIARPTQQMYDKIAQNVRKNLLTSGILPTAPDNQNTQADTQTTPTSQATSTNNVATYLQGKLTTATSDNSSTPHQATPTTTSNADTNGLMVWMQFNDKHNVLPLLVEEEAVRYFALCDELLTKMLSVLLAQPNLSGVVLTKCTPFTRQGAGVYLDKKSADVADTKLVLAAAMLSKLAVLVADVVYKKHRELGYFALPMQAVACQADELAYAQKLLRQHSENSLVMLAKAKVAPLATLMNIAPFSAPSSIYERNCYAITALSDTLAATLTKLRKQTLSQQKT